MMTKDEYSEMHNIVYGGKPLSMFPAVLYAYWRDYLRYEYGHGWVTRLY